MPPSFQSFALSPALLQVVAELGYAQPTPVQVASLPLLLQGRDFIGQSKTGSGKTVAFALPILEQIELGKRSLQALVLCPTRELCSQIAREIRKLGRHHPGLSVLEIMGGQPGRPQREALARGVHIAVGTPGRVLDHLRRGALEPRGLKSVVLDEADRMLDMGFEEEVGEILTALPGERQTILFSATLPSAMEHLSRAYQDDPARIVIEDAPDTPLEIEELQLAAQEHDKLHALCWVLQRIPHESALIFCNFKATVAEVTGTLARAGLSVGRLDGDLDQFQRERVLARFRGQSLRLLVATDVAGRGIDVTGLDLVVNYELPQQPEIYVHRIGRTGRAGQRGVAVSLTRGAGDRRIEAAEGLTGRKIAELNRDTASDPGLDALLRKLARPAPMETLHLAGGRKDRIRAGDILGALTGEAGGLQGSDVGRIEVQDRLCYVAVARAVARVAAKRLNEGRIKGKRFRVTRVG